MHIFASIEQFGDLKYSNTRSGSHRQKRKIRMILLFQVQRDVTATTRKVKVVGVMTLDF